MEVNTMRNTLKIVLHYLSITLVGVAIGLLICRVIITTQIQDSSLTNFKSGLAIGHLVGTVEAFPPPDEEKLDEILTKYSELKSSSDFSEIQKKVDELIELIENMQDELKEENQKLRLLSQ